MPHEPFLLGVGVVFNLLDNSGASTATAKGSRNCADTFLEAPTQKSAGICEGAPPHNSCTISAHFSSGASGGSLHGGARSKVEKAHFAAWLHEKRAL